MKTQVINFPSGVCTEYHFETSHEDLLMLAPPKGTIVITDENIARLHGELFKEYKILSFPAGEKNKSLDTIAGLAEKLIKAGATRSTLLLGIGGGMVTDVTGFLAATFMRGIAVAYVPTSILGQVDASVGGKNGVNLGLHKNMLGTFRQPSFIAFNSAWFVTLPDQEWSNGFAEIIKYGHISDRRILTTLQEADVHYFQKHPSKLSNLIEGCVDAKNKIVLSDEDEAGVRCMLNFGHSAGHAFETLYGLSHGQAVGLGMLVAARLSELHSGLEPDCFLHLKSLLQNYNLPTRLAIDEEKVMSLLGTDKKRCEKGIEYVLLEKPGVAVTKILKPEEIREGLKAIAED